MDAGTSLSSDTELPGAGTARLLAPVGEDDGAVDRRGTARLAGVRDLFERDRCATRRDVEHHGHLARRSACSPSRAPRRRAGRAPWWRCRRCRGRSSAARSCTCELRSPLTSSARALFDVGKESHVPAYFLDSRAGEPDHVREGGGVALDVSGRPDHLRRHVLGDRSFLDRQRLRARGGTRVAVDLDGDPALGGRGREVHALGAGRLEGGLVLGLGARRGRGCRRWAGARRRRQGRRCRRRRTRRCGRVHGAHGAHDLHSLGVAGPAARAAPLGSVGIGTIFARPGQRPGGRGVPGAVRRC